jgi:hypothetical protein
MLFVHEDVRPFEQKHPFKKEIDHGQDHFTDQLHVQLISLIRTSTLALDHDFQIEKIAYSGDASKPLGRVDLEQQHAESQVA